MLSATETPTLAVRDAPRWATFRDQRVVLAVARTFTSTVVLLDALDVFRGDPRVQVVFSFDDTSAFNDGTAALLRDRQVRLLPWQDARRLPARLVLTASENVDLDGLGSDVPVVVLPHGIGFQKYVPDSRGESRRLSGVPHPELTDRPNLHLVVSHPSQREQLRATHPALADRAHVVGDAAHDRIRASLRLRDRYRARLGAGPGHRLVVLTSTWGENGLLGTHPDLPARLLAELPYDRYRVAAVLHPNIWFRHSPWQVRHALRDALDAGLRLVPPHAGWGAALVAADCTIGDHGSVTLQAAALDRPLLLGAFAGPEEVVAGTAVTRLAELAPRMDPTGDPHRQVAAAIDTHPAGRYAEVSARAFSHAGAARRRLTAFCYHLIDLDPRPNAGRVRALPPPEPERAPATAFEVYSRLEGAHTAGSDTGDPAAGTGSAADTPTDAGAEAVVVERFPAAVRAPVDPPAGFRHLAAADTCDDDTLVRSASVVYSAELRALAAARSWAEEALSEHPGCLMTAATTPEGCLVTVRGGRTVRVTVDEPVDVCLLATAVYTLLRAGRDLATEVPLRVGEREWWCALGPT